MSSVNEGYGFGSFLGTFVVGAAAGAVVALLTAPRSGRETRARLKEAARDMEGTLQQIPGALQQAGAKAVKAGQEAFTHAKEEATHAYSKATEARQGTKDYKGYTVDKELPRFAK